MFGFGIPQPQLAKCWFPTEGRGTEVVVDARRNEHPPKNCLETSLVAVQHEKSNLVPEDSEEPETCVAVRQYMWRSQCGSTVEVSTVEVHVAMN